MASDQEAVYGPILVRFATSRICAGVAIATVALGAVLTASAGAAVVHVTDDQTFTGPGSLKVACPSGMGVLSGGMGTVNGYGGILLTGSYPYDGPDKDSAPDDGWKVDVTNRGGLEVEVDALCSKQKVKYVHEAFKFPRFNDGTGSVACPSGTHIISGGGRAGTLIGLLPGDGKDSDKKPDDKFTVHTESGATGKTKGVAWATCGKAKVRYVTTKTAPIGSHTESDESDALCPAGSVVLGGGAGMNVGHRDGAINSLFPRVDEIQAWGAYLDNYDRDKTHVGRVTAVCSA
jgi:hypothetical protein